MEFLQGLDFLRMSLQNCWLLFSHIMDRAGAAGWYFGAVFTVMVFRFFLYPLIGGSGGSDKAKKSGKKDK